MGPVQSLRKNGWKVFVDHHRYVENKMVPMGTIPPGSRQVFSPRGGCTDVVLTSPDGETFMGNAHCSRKDNFDRKLGLGIAIGRALSSPPVKGYKFGVTNERQS